MNRDDVCESLWEDVKQQYTRFLETRADEDRDLLIALVHRHNSIFCNDESAVH